MDTAIVERVQRGSYLGTVTSGDDEDEDRPTVHNYGYNCPSCLAAANIASKLTRKILVPRIKKKQRMTPFGPTRTRYVKGKDAISELDLDDSPGKQYLQCRRCGDVYLLDDLENAKRAQDRIDKALEQQEKIWDPNTQLIMAAIKRKARREAKLLSSPVKGKIRLTRKKITVVRKIP